MNMYDGPGAVSVEITLTILRLPYTERRAPASNSQCGVFRALQGWTSLSTTGADEGTLRGLSCYSRKLGVYDDAAVLQVSAINGTPRTFI